jgi:MFS family permease
MIIALAVLQGVLWLPLLVIPYFPHPAWWLLVVLTLNTAVGMLIGPVWNSYMSDIVEEDFRGTFFGKRNLFTGLSAFATTLLAGGILYVAKPHPILGFSILFALAFILRIMSAWFLDKMADVPDAGVSTSDPDVVDFAMHAQKSPLGRFTIFLMLFNVAVYLASPFFAVYQLSVLGFDYWTFTLLASASAISSFCTMLLWGKFVDRIGARNVLVSCGLLIPLVPFLWTLTVDPWKLGVVEVFSGVVWAGFNLSVSTYLFDATDRKTRTRKLAEYTLLVQVAVFAGALLGSGVLHAIGDAGRPAFITIFLASAVLRLVVLLIFAKTIIELRIVQVPIRGRVFRRFVAIRPQHGVVYEPAVETPHDAGYLARSDPRDIAQEVGAYARKARNIPKTETAIKRLERAEDEQDTARYLRKLKR